MSFILDALKKSENERQAQTSTEFSAVGGPADAPRAPRWLWLLGALLIVNLVVVAGLLLRPAADAPVPVDAMPVSAPPVAVRAEPVPAPADTAAEPTFADRIEEARRTRPAIESPEPVAESSTHTPPAAGAPAPDADARTGIAALPTLMELQVKGDVSLPPLHIDLHVYNDDPARRFVSINMSKYREREKLREGPTVRQITREGVILEYQGRSFALFQ